MDITEDLRVTVGGIKCNVTKIGYNIVICAPERPTVFTDNEPSQLVMVCTTDKCVYTILSEFVNSANDMT